MLRERDRCPVCLCVLSVINFGVTVYCGQTVGWIKMPLGTEVGLGPGDIVLEWDLAPTSERGTAAPSAFRPMSIVAKRSPILATTELLVTYTGSKVLIVAHL